MHPFCAWLSTLSVALGAPLRLLRLWSRGEGRDQLAERLGSYSVRTKHAVTNRHVLWLRAVDAAGVRLCAHLIRVLEPRVPNVKMVVSAETTDGMRESHRRLPGYVEKVGGPLDLRRCVAQAVATLHPNAVALVGSQLTPFLLRRLRDRGTPVILLDSPPSGSRRLRYRLGGAWFRPLLAAVAGAGVQTEADAAQLVRLGVRRETVRILGALRFETVPVEEPRLIEVAGLLQQLGVPKPAPLLVVSGTEAGEESILAETCQRLRTRHPDLFLILAPQRVERGLTERGVRFAYRREMTAATQRPARSVECLLLNAPGELKAFLAEATLVVLGQTFAGTGGQNPTAPAALGKPIVFGPSLGDFAPLATRLVEAGGAVQVRDAAELEAVLDRLLGDPAQRAVLGRNARRTIQGGTGALDRAADMIVGELACVEGLYTR
jgi:3-deoxy-D-manno-octulosonic-acid transferase